jgi:hypothetical protein
VLWKYFFSPMGSVTPEMGSGRKYSRPSLYWTAHYEQISRTGKIPNKIPRYTGPDRIWKKTGVSHTHFAHSIQKRRINCKNEIESPECVTKNSAVRNINKKWRDPS